MPKQKQGMPFQETPHICSYKTYQTQVKQKILGYKQGIFINPADVTVPQKRYSKPLAFK